MYPHQRKRYADNWEDISLAYRERTFWRCEQCDVAQGMWRISKSLHEHYRVNLQVAHLNHDTTDNRDENLMSLCQDCHLKHDGPENSRKAIQTKYRKKLEAELAAGQLELFFDNEDTQASKQVG